MSIVRRACAWGVAFVVAAAAMLTEARAGSWSSGGGCVGFPSGCDAAICGAQAAWGPDLDGYSIASCSYQSQTVVRLELEKELQNIGIVTRHNHASLTCAAGESLTERGCEPDVPQAGGECRHVSNGGMVGNPINLANGVKQQSALDMVVGVGPDPLRLERFYNAVSPRHMDAGSRLGGGWRTNFDIAVSYQSIRSGMPTSVAFRMPDGFELSFTKPRFSPDYVRESLLSGRDNPDGWSLTSQADQLFLRDPRDTVYRFDVDMVGAFPNQTLTFTLLDIAFRSGATWTLQNNGARIVDDYGAWIEFGLPAEQGGATYLPVTGSDGVRVTYELTKLANVALGAPLNDQVVPVPYFGELAPIDAVLTEVSIEPVDLSAPAETTRYVYGDQRYPYHLRGIIDARGVQVASWGYDEFGRAISSAGATVGGVQTGLHQMSYGAPDVDGTAINSVTGPLGRQADYTIEDAKIFAAASDFRRVVAMIEQPTTHADRAGVTFGFDSIDQAPQLERREVDGVSVVDRTVDIDAEGRLLSRTFAAGRPEARTISYEWHPTLRVPTRIIDPALDVRVVYDAAGRPITVTMTDRLAPTDSTGALYAPTDRVWTYTYSAEGLLLSENGPLTPSGGAPDDVTTYAYDAQGRLTSVTDALGYVTRIDSLNGRGQPLQVTGPDGVVTQYAYDFRGRVTSVVDDALGAPRLSSFVYDAVGLMTRTVDADGVVLDFAYDDAKRLIRITNAAGEEVRFEHDAMGNVTRESLHDGPGAPAVWESLSQFDEIGRLRTLIGGEAQERRFVYDRLGRMTEITDGIGAATPTPADGVLSLGYDGLDRVISTLDRVGAQEASAYGPSGDRTVYDDPRGLRTELERNGFGDVVEERSPDRGVRRFYYDARGDLVRSVDARGVETLSSYDALGRLATVAYPGVPSGAEDLAFTYGAVGSGAGAGQVATIDDASGLTAFRYGPDGRLVGLDRTREGLSYAVDVGLSLGERIETIAYPSGRIARMTYDAKGDVIQVATENGVGGPLATVASGLDYAAFGPLVEMTYGNGVIHRATYDRSFRPTDWRETLGGVALRAGTYGYDANDNVVSIAHGVLGGVETLSYDAEDRLTRLIGPYGDETFAYDALGNRIARGLTPSVGPIESETLSYPTDSNRLSAVTAQPGAVVRPFTYDANGNVVSDTRGADVYGYDYDQSDRLSEVRLNGVTIARYVYDFTGQLAIRKTYDPSTGALLASVHVIHDLSGRRIAEHDGVTGAVLREYLWLGDRPIGLVEAGTLYFVHSDPLDRPILITDGTGTALWSARYRAFGAPADITVAPSVATDLRWPGQWFQAEAGLHQNWFRDYDPTLGRYLQPDRLGLVDGPSVYGYAHQNPYKYVDPTGELAFLARAAIAGGLGGAANLVGQLAGNGWRLGCVNWGGVAAGALAGATGLEIGYATAGRPGRGITYSHFVPARAGKPDRGFPRFFQHGRGETFLKKGNLWNGNYVTERRHYKHDKYYYGSKRGVWRQWNGRLPTLALRLLDRAPNRAKGLVGGLAAAFGLGLGLGSSGAPASSPSAGNPACGC